ncbi:MAG TPA: CHAT domain-containing protein [Blastocatellia bacterium]|nr:CHAT domain-containing protein [Blastocatellia bacterium]
MERDPFQDVQKKDLLVELLAASSAEKRQELLDSNTELVTRELSSKLISRGIALSNRGDFARALTAFQLAAKVSEQLRDNVSIAVALVLASEVHNLQGNYEAALDLSKRSLGVAIDINDELQIATARNTLGKIHVMMGNDAEGESELKSAIAIYEKHGDKRGLAAGFNNLALIFLNNGDYVQARSCLEKARLLSSETGERSELAKALHYLGNVENRLGNYTNALKYYEASLQIKEEIGEKSTIARTTLNIGIAYDRLGNRVKALEYLQRAKLLAEDLGQKQVVALVLGNIGELYYNQGNYQQALEYFHAALKLHTELNDRRERARMLNSIANAYAAENNPESIAYWKASLQIMTELGDKEAVSAALNNIAGAYAGGHDYDKALEMYEESLKTKRELGNRSEVARSLANIADVRLAMKNYDRVLELAGQAAALAKENGNLDVYWDARCAAGHAHNALGHFDQAAQAFADTIESIETARKDVVGGEEDNQLFFQGNVNPYLWMVDALVKQNKCEEALQYSERARSRVLLEVLRSGKVNVTRAMTGYEKEREQHLGHRLNTLNAELQRARAIDPDAAGVVPLKAEIQRARLEYESFHTGLYAAHPDLKVQRGDVEPFKIDDAGALIGDANAGLLEFVVLPGRTLLFVLTPAGPPSAEGKTRKIDFKVYSIKITQESLTEFAGRFRESLSARRSGFQEMGTKLYELLLGPALEQLGSSSELVIVPGGVLWELPFQALQSPRGRYLIEDHAVSYAPSLSVLREMRRRRLNRRMTPLPAEDLLAFGNPAIGKQAASKIEAVMAAQPLEPLPQAERQVRILKKIYGARSRVYIGPAALEARLKAEASSCRVLHLATHGILNDTSPMYSQIVLSQTASDDSEDGLLEAWEIMKLDLNAELVVLSACETARGKVREGEGLVGLSWAIFVAGCPTTLVSQWKVGASSTTTLMVEFHKNLLAMRRGDGGRTGKAQALRLAALKLLSVPRFRHPFYWAPFVVVGDGS